MMCPPPGGGSAVGDLEGDDGPPVANHLRAGSELAREGGDEGLAEGAPAGGLRGLSRAAVADDDREARGPSLEDGLDAAHAVGAAPVLESVGEIGRAHV